MKQYEVLEPEIGEEFEFRGMHFRCEVNDGDCADCGMPELGCRQHGLVFPACTREAREDRTSVIFRKIEASGKPGLPDWCEIGAWIHHTPGGFGRIHEIDGDWIKCNALDGGFLNFTFGNDDTRPACVRPWTFEEAPVLLKVRNRNGEFDILYLEYQSADDGTDQFMYFSQRNKEDLELGTVAEEFIQCDGQPCGVLEVRNSIQEKE